MAGLDATALVELGLTGNESVVYLSLLESGPSVASRIAERSGLYRPNVYDALKRLLAKNLASYVRKGGMRVFSAAKPDVLNDVLDRKREALVAALPSLYARVDAAKETADVQVLEGKNALRVAFRDIYRSLEQKPGGPLWIGVDDQLFVKADVVALHQYFAFLKRHHLRERVLIREGDTFTPGQETTHYRALPAKYFNAQPTAIYGDSVSFLFLTEPTLVILIHSPALAESYRKQFELAWSLSKPVRATHAKKAKAPGAN